jgi:hypothetical protein
VTHDVGDWRVPKLTVDPFDATTQATLEIVRPSDGSITTPTPVSDDGGHIWTAPGYELVVAGEWIERWTVTGAGAGRERFVLLVAPDPADAPSGERVYATTTDYAKWLRKAPPAGARRALAAASRDVERMTVTAVYDVDSAMMPTDAKVRAAMRDATCAQADHNRANGDPYGIGGPRIQSAGIGKVNITRAAPLPIARYSADAWQILQDAGLTNGELWT